jgi:hypothetical protein
VAGHGDKGDLTQTKMCIAVADEAGDLKAFFRMDGAPNRQGHALARRGLRCARFAGVLRHQPRRMQSGSDDRPQPTQAAGSYVFDAARKGALRLRRRLRLLRRLPIDFDVMPIRQKRLVRVCNEACIIGKAPAHPFRQSGFKVYPFPSEPIVSTPVHPWRALWEWHC